MKKLKIIFIGLMLLPLYSIGQTASDNSPSNAFYDTFLAQGLLLLGGLVIIGAFSVLLHLLNTMFKIQEMKVRKERNLPETEKDAKVGFSLSTFLQQQYKVWTNAVPIDREKDVLLDHNYDGIQELDNSLPPWWLAMFYITIAIGVVYMGYYHWSGEGLSSSEEYELSMVQAEKEIKAYRASLGETIDETNVTVLTDQAALDLGKTLYNANCVACHGLAGEGGVGPNLTDEYWIHGGDIQSIFSTIKYGVIEKGMISWKSQLRPVDMQKISSYILTFQGTSPPNGKEPQGEKYIPESSEGPLSMK
jgi:cytochrome c oxidase cbb3-type subunit 3